jgi:hypothetical protein
MFFLLSPVPNYLIIQDPIASGYVRMAGTAADESGCGLVTHAKHAA